MAYNGGILPSVRRARVRFGKLFVAVATGTGNSVRYGSALTGAPGQPVDTGELLLGWKDGFVRPFHWRLTTNVPHAPHVERNARGVTFRNGGPHSVDKTIAGFPRIVADANASVPR